MYTHLLAASIATAAPPTQVRVTALNEAIALPLGVLIPAAPRPGASIGVSLRARERGRIERRIFLDLSAYHHPMVENAVSLHAQWQTTWWAMERLGLSAWGGLGPKLAVYPGEVYTRQADGGWEADIHLGHPEVSASAGLGLEVPVSTRWSVIGQHRSTIDLPFHIDGALPFMSHVSLHVGLACRL